MELSNKQKQEIKSTFIPYRGDRLSTKQKSLLEIYGLRFEQDRGRAYFVYGEKKLRVPLTKTHGRASKNVVSKLIRLIEGR